MFGLMGETSPAVDVTSNSQLCHLASLICLSLSEGHARYMQVLTLQGTLFDLDHLSCIAHRVPLTAFYSYIVKLSLKNCQVETIGISTTVQSSTTICHSHLKIEKSFAQSIPFQFLILSSSLGLVDCLSNGKLLTYM